MTTTDFDDRLLDALLDEYDLLTAAESETRPARIHRRGWIAGALAVGTAVVAVGATDLAATSGSAPRGIEHAHGAGRVAYTGLPAQQPVRGDDIAYVVKRIKRALNANTDVLHELVHAPNSQTGRPTVTETWSRGATDTTHTITLDPHGHPLTGYLVTVTRHRTMSIMIDYAQRTWREQTFPFGSQTSGPAPAPATPTEEAAQLRAQVRSGLITLIGRRRVDGQPAIELKDTTSKHGTIDLWVDPLSYLPLRELDIAAGANADSSSTIQIDDQWLPATAANLAQLTPSGSIPAGFQRATSD